MQIFQTIFPKNPFICMRLKVHKIFWFLKLARSMRANKNKRRSLSIWYMIIHTWDILLFVLLSSISLMIDVDFLHQMWWSHKLIFEWRLFSECIIKKNKCSIKNTDYSPLIIEKQTKNDEFVKQFTLLDTS
jgi:hypothetical protein